MSPDRVAKGEDHPNTRFTFEQIQEMRRLYASGMTAAAIGTLFGTAQGVAWNIVTGRSRKNA